MCGAVFGREGAVRAAKECASEVAEGGRSVEAPPALWMVGRCAL